jgi:hypothetical protein
MLFVMTIVDLNAFQSPKFGSTGMGTGMFQTSAKKSGWQIMNQIWNGPTEVRFEKPHSGGMRVLHGIFPD